MPRPDSGTAVQVDTDMLLLGALADELLSARALAENLGMALCVDPVVVDRHRIQLQDLDLLAQLLEQSARLLRVSIDRAGAVDGVTLAAMRTRLNAALGHSPAPAPDMDDEIW
jgi:hypothetical protein